MIPASTAMGLILLAWSAWTTIYRAEQRNAIGGLLAVFAYVWTYMVIGMIVGIRTTYPAQANGSVSAETIFSAILWPIHVTWVLVNKVFG